MTESRKIFINHTDKDINITLFIREGNSPEDEGGTEMVSVSKHDSVEMIYEGEPGSDGYVFLNGLLIEWSHGNNLVGVSRRVVTRGDLWDNTLNTHDTLTISDLEAGTLSASGSNSRL
ncbi:MAG TPA: hypothetical protein VKP65_15985 [Rhodothermales bacterium]|nr:hypothetical protein [Rhodothermales bacterium]